MSKLLKALGVVVAVAVLALLVFRDDDDDYLVRAIFDNGSFMVEGAEVRIGGATAGDIKTVDVTMPGEVNSYRNGKPEAIPGKAVIVLRIDDPGFQDFRRDARCLVRPQSLIGEKFVDCDPTRPRAPGSPVPPPLREIPEGEPGEGELLLPLENNSSTVDPDLINNINSLPYAQRFRLILNELGVGLAGRGEDIEEAVKRANPVLRDATELLGTLSKQRRELAQLNVDADRILVALARERTSVSGFFANSGAAAEASAERGEALEASFRKLPEFLRQFRQTMRGLQGFSDAAAPVFADLDRATPALTRATEALAPFSDASTVALKSLGATGEEAGPDFLAAAPIARKTRRLAETGARPTTELARFMTSTTRTKGWEGLVDLIYNTNAAFNEFDKYGHFVRSMITLADCIVYVTAPRSGCIANFIDGEASASAFDPVAFYQRIQREIAERGGEATEGGAVAAPDLLGDREPGEEPPPETTPALPDLGQGQELGDGQQPEADASSSPSAPQRALLDYLLGP